MPRDHVDSNPGVGTRPFAVIWAGQAVSLLGSSVAQFSLIWWLTLETGSGMVLATASLVGLLPPILLGPIAGALVDRFSRKRIMLAADTGIALAAAGLAILFFRGTVEHWHIFALLFVRAIGGAFHGPALTASTSLMVRKQQLGRVQGANQMLQAGLTIVSAPIGAALLAVMSIGSILLVDVGTAIVAVLTLALAKVPQPRRRPESAELSPLDQIREGLDYLQQRTGLLTLVGIAAAINLLLTPTFAMLPLLVTEHFGGGALQLGAMSSVFGIGTLVGGVSLAAIGALGRSVMTSFWSILAMGLATFAIGLCPPDLPIVAFAALFVVGAMAALVNGPLSAILQATVDPAFQGRVFTLLGSLSAASAPVGLVLAGPAVDLIGVQSLYLLAGASCCIMGWLATRSPAAKLGIAAA